MPPSFLIYDGTNLQITINKEAILRGWRDKPSGLWRIPLSKAGPPQKQEYVLLPKGSEEVINNVYELPSTEQVIRYLHACAGFPTKTTWIKAIWAGSYATWPHFTVTAVHKHFPESDETKNGHMRNIKQGIRSTKTKRTPF